MLIDQNRINLFADATDDHQWIHVDPERAAREFPLGTTCAHGYLTISLIPALIEDVVQVQDLERIINFGINKARFRSMVPSGRGPFAAASSQGATSSSPTRPATATPPASRTANAQQRTAVAHATHAGSACRSTHVNAAATPPANERNNHPIQK